MAIVDDSPPRPGVAGCPPTAPVPVPRPLLHHVWTDVAFVHWPYEPDVVRRRLPEGVDIDVFDGAAWVGLVPFHLRIRPARLPALPWLSHFEEMNVRTYVTGPEGGSGVWFVSLDAARLVAVAIARATYGLSYCWARMRFARVGDVATYSARRRWPGHRSAQGTLAIHIGDEIEDASMTDLDRFLTSRWAFYCKPGSAVRKGWVEHDRWPLRRARLLHCDPGLLAAWGLPLPATPPVVHFSPGVTVAMSYPRRVAAPR